MLLKASFATQTAIAASACAVQRSAHNRLVSQKVTVLTRGDHIGHRRMEMTRPAFGSPFSGEPFASANSGIIREAGGQNRLGIDFWTEWKYLLGQDLTISTFTR